MEPSPAQLPGTGLLLLLALLLPAADGIAEPSSVPLLDGSRDRIVREEPVPSAAFPVGRVRLVRRGEAIVVQTVHDTAFLDRVVDRIRKKEAAAWPPDRRGHDDSERYVAALLSARAGVRRRMLIEFILSADAALVAIAEPELAEGNGELRVVSRREIALLPLSRAYVRGNMREIARDALKLDREESRRLLEPILPPE